jgi:integrin beta 3
MAGNGSGVIPRPGETTTGRVSVPGSPGHGTGAIAPGRATGAVGVGQVSGTVNPARVTGAASAVAAVGAASVGAASVAAPGRGVAPGVAPTDPDDPSSARPLPDLRAAAGADRDENGEAISGFRGARTELRRRMRERRRLRMITLSVLTLVVLLALPAFFGIRSATRDPVFTSLNALSVPAWAAGKPHDLTSGSRWCFLRCRFRERTLQSAKSPDETAKTYQAALTAAGWQPWQVAQCPEQKVDGSYTCWRRDEFTLDLWVRQPSCAVDALAEQDAGLAATQPPAAGAAPACSGATVSIKVRNAITDERGRPEPQPNPSLIGETPDPILTDDPLGATPSPS